MLRYLYADQLDQFPKLADQMFRHRADQFYTRLGMSPLTGGAMSAMNTIRSIRFT